MMELAHGQAVHRSLNIGSCKATMLALCNQILCKKLAAGSADQINSIFTLCPKYNPDFHMNLCIIITTHCPLYVR